MRCVNGRLRLRQPRIGFRVLALAIVSLGTANCGSPPPQVSTAGSGRSVDPRYGVAPSPRVVGENDPVPKGGGRDLVGRPYMIAGRTYVPRQNPAGYTREGLASWYGTAFHGRLTANGEIFDRTSIAAAHPTLPLPSYARVTNLANNHSMIVRVNDRGPYHADRLIDVSQRVAEALGFERIGTTRVRVDYVGRASLRGSDDRKLMASLRTDGRPAPFPGQRPTMVADAGDAFGSRGDQAPTPLAFRSAAADKSETAGEDPASARPVPAVAVAARNEDPERSRDPAPRTAVRVADESRFADPDRIGGATTREAARSPGLSSPVLAAGLGSSRTRLEERAGSPERESRPKAVAETHSATRGQSVTEEAPDRAGGSPKRSAGPVRLAHAPIPPERPADLGPGPSAAKQARGAGRETTRHATVALN